MGKRSTFKRRPQDKYRTFDLKAGEVLAPHVPAWCRYWEPCAAGLDLVRNLGAVGLECAHASDICPESTLVDRLDALTVTRAQVDEMGVTHIITNSPWTRPILHQMILQFSAIRPTWLLFDADWAHTDQARPYLPHCRKIVSVGRLRWIEGTNQTGKDNCAWYLFDQSAAGITEFIARAA